MALGASLTSLQIRQFKAEVLRLTQDFSSPTLDTLAEERAESLRQRISKVGQDCFESMFAAYTSIRLMRERFDDPTLTHSEAIAAYVLDKNGNDPAPVLAKLSSTSEEQQVVICRVATEVLPALKINDNLQIRAICSFYEAEDMRVIAALFA